MANLRMRIRASFDPRQRYKIPLDQSRLVAQVRAHIQSHPNLVQLGRLLLAMVRADDGSEWLALCCPVCDDRVRPREVDGLEVFDLVQTQASEIGRAWFKLMMACAEVFCERWRQSTPVSHLEFDRAKGHVEQLIDSAKEFMTLIAYSKLGDVQWRRLEHLLLQAKDALCDHYNIPEESTAYNMLHLEKALWCIHELVDLLGDRLGLRPAA